MAAILVVTGIREAMSTIPSKPILESRPGYRAYQVANLLVPEFGDRLLQIGFENGVYFFDGLVIGDWFGPGRYRSLVDCPTNRARFEQGCAVLGAPIIRSKMAEFGTSMLLVKITDVSINRDEYSRHFDVAYEDAEALLLTVRRSK